MEKLARCPNEAGGRMDFSLNTSEQKQMGDKSNHFPHWILCVSKTLPIDPLHPLKSLTDSNGDFLGKGGFYGDRQTPKSSFFLFAVAQLLTFRLR